MRWAHHRGGLVPVGRSIGLARAPEVLERQAKPAPEQMAYVGSGQQVHVEENYWWGPWWPLQPPDGPAHP